MWSRHVVTNKTGYNQRTRIGERFTFLLTHVKVLVVILSLTKDNSGQLHQMFKQGLTPIKSSRGITTFWEYTYYVFCAEGFTRI